MDPTSTDSKRPSISLVLPAWNESEVIASAMAEADAALRQVSDDYEIIVVDDGSTDGMDAIVERAAQTNPNVRLIRHNPNRGYGAALRSGFEAATKSRVMFTDADCQFDLTEIDRFILLANRYPIVCGYRIDRKDSALRCLYSRVYNQLVRLLLRTEVRDVDCAFKMFHAGVIKDLPITGSGFLVNSEILTQAKLRGHEIVEVGVTHRPRTAGSSTVSISHIPKVLRSLARYWWNTVQFPATPTIRDAGESSISQTGSIGSQTGSLAAGGVRASLATAWVPALMLLIAALFLMTNLSYPLIDRDETRYAEIPREMVTTGQWIVPQLNFQTYYDKPPLLYWLCATSYKLFGITESAARLVPAMAAWLTLALTIGFGGLAMNRRVGTLGAGVLLLSVGFAFTSRYLLIDGVFSLFVAATMFAGYLALKQEKLDRRLWIAAGVACGAAAMAKGPIAFVLTYPALFVFAWLSDGYAKLTYRDHALFVGAATLVTLPWLIAVTVAEPSFLPEFLVTHNLQRFKGEFHNRPFWYFVPVLLLAGHPWSFLTIPYGQFLWSQTPSLMQKRPPVVGFLLIWSVWCFGFFSLSGCKLPTYLLPAAPALALMMGHYLDQILGDTSRQSKHRFAQFWSARTATASTCLAGVGLVGFIVLAEPQIGLSVYVWALVWTMFLVCALLLLGDRRQAKTAWATSSAASFLLAVMVMHELLPAYAEGETLLGRATPLRQSIDAVGDLPILTVAHEFSEIPFYLRRSDVHNFSLAQDDQLRNFIVGNPHALLVVSSNLDDADLARRLPRDCRIKSSGRQGRVRWIELIAQPTETETEIAMRRRTTTVR